MSSSSLDKKAYVAIGLISFAIVMSLVWFIYGRQELGQSGMDWSFLAGLNASLNFITSCFLVLGYYFIKTGKKEAHIKSMLMATGTSGLFLIGYLLYHHFQGETKFLTQGLIRPIYFFILISHIILSAVLVPMVFGTLYHAGRKNFEKHLKLARWTFPVWLYVSVSGVAVFFFLKYLNQ